MSIDQDGFLSPDIQHTKAINRAHHPDEFVMVGEMNRVAQSALPGFGSLKRTPKNLIACAYYIRALQSAQAAVLMAELGLISEAFTLVRSGLETVFYLGAAVRTRNFNNELARDHVKRMNVVLERFKKVMPQGDPEVDTAELDAVLQSMLPDGVNPATVSIEALAIKADLSHLYDGLYRPLSASHAHPSLLSLNSIWDVGDGHETVGVLWGPDRCDPKDIKDALHLCVAVLYNLISQWTYLLEQNGQSNSPFQQSVLQVGEKYMQALHEVGPQPSSGAAS